MTDYDSIAPTAGDIANSYEVILDINTGTSEAPTWLNIPDITAFNPTSNPKTADVATYAHKGGDALQKVGETFSATFNLLKIRDDEGEFQAEWIALKEAADADGEDNLIEFRYYDALGASEAYQGKAAVQRARANTGNADPGFDTFTLTGNGRAKPITNPVLGSVE